VNVAEHYAEAVVPKRYAPELVFAAVAPSGIEFDLVRRVLAARLAAYGYDLVDIRVSQWLRRYSGLDPTEAERPDVRIPRLQEVGDDVRRLACRPEALAYIAIREITVARQSRNLAEGIGSADAPSSAPLGKTAYLIWSLKHDREVEVLRQVYGSHFFLFSAYAPVEEREERLAALMAERSGTTRGARRFLNDARKVIETDENEPILDGDYGQNVRDAYPLADFFVDASSEADLQATATRSVDIVFGDPFATPTKDEFAMFTADAAGHRSAELGRQVGAVIATETGDIVAIGTNEVPAHGGGHFWATGRNEISPEDNREFRNRIDTSDKTKRLLAREIFLALKESGAIDKAVTWSDDELYKVLEKTGLRELTEYGRAVHAELSALMDAARRGVGVSGQTIYVTTFPCHHCSRHVVAAGLRRLVYIFPYAKSRARDLHGDTIQTTGLGRADKRRVQFQPFLGVAPRRYQTAFRMTKRKDDTGTAVPEFDPGRSPRLPDEGADGQWDVGAHIDREIKALVDINEWLPRVEKELGELASARRTRAAAK
jgi:deoxycytidylate deaminase